MITRHSFEPSASADHDMMPVRYCYHCRQLQALFLDYYTFIMPVPRLHFRQAIHWTRLNRFAFDLGHQLLSMALKSLRRAGQIFVPCRYFTTPVS